MFEVGLTGGIGAGKSTVAAVWVDLGAYLIDADALARKALEPGMPPYEAVVAQWGSRVVKQGGEVDRAALAALIFGNETAKATLEGIIHPWVRAETSRITAHAPPDAIVVHDVPLLVETGRYRDMDYVVVVQASESLRLARLLERGLTAHDARRRMQAQASDAERCAVADVVISNDADVSDLRCRATEAWEQITRLAAEHT